MAGPIMTLDLGEVRRAIAASDDDITAEQLDVLRAAAESWLLQEEALERAVAELRAFAADRVVEVGQRAGDRHLPDLSRLSLMLRVGNST